jgi:hypothetical protein
MGTERDETHVILIKDRQLSSIKADLIHAFLSVSYTLYWILFYSMSTFLISLIFFLFYYSSDIRFKSFRFVADVFPS